MFNSVRALLARWVCTNDAAKPSPYHKVIARVPPRRAVLHVPIRRSWEVQSELDLAFGGGRHLMRILRQALQTYRVRLVWVGRLPKAAQPLQLCSNGEVYTEALRRGTEPCCMSARHATDD